MSRQNLLVCIELTQSSHSGLGIGVAADTLIELGHKVHIVEIDPAVYTYARGFFNLSEPFSIDFKDARKWVHERYVDLNTAIAPVLDVAVRESKKFPIIIHDCFSGGGVPSHLFTREFWNELKGIMTDDGALAVNFVGHVGSESARAIWFTLQEAFSLKNGGRGCRVFHDVLPEYNEGRPVNSTDLINMIYFCQNDGHATTTRTTARRRMKAESGVKDTKKVEFRKGEQEDYLGSYMRYRVLSSMLQREITEKEMTGFIEGEKVNRQVWILTDKRNRLDEWQQAVAVEHWGRASI